MLSRRVLPTFAWVGGAAVVAFAVLPLVYAVLLSLARDPVGGISWPPTLANYRGLASPTFGFYPALWRSLALSTGTTLVSMLLAVPAAYALGRLPIPGRARLMAAMIALPFFPGILLLVPLRRRLAEIGLFDQLSGIGLAQLSTTLPLAVWFMATAFRQVPDEVLDAARLDGAGTPTLIRRMVLPMSLPAVGGTTALVFTLSWNDYLFASGLSQSRGSETLQVVLSKLPVLGFLGGQMAAGVLMCLPAGLVVAALLTMLVRRA